MNIILIYFACKYLGDWDKIYSALQNKEKVQLNTIVELEQKIKNENWETITILDENYPEKLKHAYKPPFVLWIKGNKEIFKKELICLTGSNLVDSKVKVTIDNFINKLSSNYAFVTTNFQGVDQYVLNQSENNAIVVLSQGLNNFDKKSFNLIVTEYPDTTEETRETMRARNRIIAAFSKSLILVSSKKNSGIQDLVTNFLNVGKEIYCLPGSADDNDGNTDLIKHGATLITRPDEIM